MRIIILGAAAGGGLPQWNCGCKNCEDARAGTIPALSQSSVAVSADGENWVLLNASPDIRTQLQAEPALHPKSLRESPLTSVVLTNGDIDHVAGLLVLREKSAFEIFATQEILGALAENPVFGVLDPEFVRQNAIVIDQEFEPAKDLRVRAFLVPGKVPLYQEGAVVDTKMMSENTIALELNAGGKTLIYVPGCAEIRPELLERVRNADLLLFDGTVWQDDEMIETQTGAKTGARMGHVAMKGSAGSMASFASLENVKKIYLHINNTNPVLQPSGAERKEAEAAGWVIGQDGMEITL